MDSIVAQVKEIAANADWDKKKIIALELRNLSQSLEDRYDTLQRVMYGVSLVIHLTLSTVLTCIASPFFSLPPELAKN